MKKNYGSYAFQWDSLKTRVTLFSLAIFLLGIWSLAYYSSRMLHRDLEKLLGDQQFSTVSYIAAEVNHEIEFRHPPDYKPTQKHHVKVDR